MGILKKKLLIIGSIIILFTMILLCNGNKISVKAINERQNPVKAAVLLYRFDDVYTSLVRQGFEEIQKKNPDKIEFTFYDGKNDQGIQNQTIDTLLENKSEAIISNNDEMAIGAIEALQKYGYNKGAGSKTITVVGVDAIPAAQELIKQGVMTGSVLQDAPAMAEACYVIGINLVKGRPPLEGTQYKFDETGVAVRIPYREYIQ